MGFTTEITLTGPVRAPAQMLQDQVIEGHATVHDADQASSLGLMGAPIEGPTHFSQFDPLAVAVWGDAWFERGCISCHFQTMVVEGEEVQASLTTKGAASARIEAHKADGTPVLTGTASIGPDHPESELDARRAAQGEPGELFIVDRLHVGQRSEASEDGRSAPPSATAPPIPSRWPRSSSGSPSPTPGTRRRAAPRRRGAGPSCPWR